MKKIVFFMSLCALLLGMNACNSNPSKSESGSNGKVTADNSQNSLDWSGNYNGVLPCADCSGIETVVSLNPNNTYQLLSRYMGKGEDEVFEQSGTFKWTADGRSVVLNNADGNGGSRTMKVGENKLFWLDNDGKIITGEHADNYILNKVNPELVEKYWKLIELFGEPVTADDVTRDAFITLRTLGNRLEGNGGCNGFFGTYQTSGGVDITFSQVGSTMMMCPKMEVEDKIKQVLEQTDNYYAKNDTLVLNRARMAPLARFVAVYM